MKDLAELFVACGGEVSSEDGNEYVSIADPIQPIEIALTVIPTGIDFESKQVTLVVLVDDKLELNNAGVLRQTEYSIEFELPIEAIELIHK